MISTLTGSAESKITTTWSTTYPKFTGTTIACQQVYNVAYGTVIFIGYAGTSYVVTVQCNSNECLRYCNLKSVNVKLNDKLEEGTLIGEADQSVLFEYCTTWRGNSTWAVRTSTKTYYKQNPQDILDGTYVIESRRPVTKVNGKQVGTVTLNSAQSAEFGDNRGADRDVEF